ncbi:hypothetical protein FRB96_008937 [Tulasnella sp. 330]|nr:hypothetical protein FRB96_008937 [Tulasnella sp. 330]KAG8873205.1 hypothetical protein FRB97_006929 [Tulasnella sp. 331]KAG8876944.1 hypothetical protein FRB98_006955 [Tulasnella sp. 332]
MFSLSKLFATAVLAAPALAHFTLDYPQTRGFDEDLEPQFCGGFPLVNRTEFPLSGGMIDIDSHHTASTFVTLISFDQNPSNFSQFNTTPSGQTYGFLKPFIQLSGTGEMCVPVDISALGLSGIGPGTNATIMVQFDGGDGELYQCADVTLTGSAVTPPPCTNSSTFVAESSGNSTTSTTSTASTSTSTSKSSAEDLMSTRKLERVAVVSAVLAVFGVML